MIADGKHPKLIAERLGHASIKLTMDTYGHLFEGDDREASATMDRTLGLKRNDSDKNPSPHPLSKKLRSLL